MLYGDGAKILIGAREFRRIKIRMIPRSMRLEDVSLAGACSLNDGKVIWAHGMEKTINGVKLCGIHLVYTPNQRGGGDDAGF